LAQRLPAITISRQTGARGRTIGRLLQDTLREQHPKAEIPWTLFDDDLVQQVLKDHNLPGDLEKFMPDDAVGELESSINEILGRHPSMWSLFEKTVSTIARLSRMGHCIIVGRGGNRITQQFDNVLRVRLVGSEEHRVRQMMQVSSMTEAAARKFVKDEDAARYRYVKQHFQSDIDNPLHYDLVLNTDHFTDAQAVAILIAAIRRG
jgi:cytidylate kinase